MQAYSRIVVAAGSVTYPVPVSAIGVSAAGSASRSWRGSHNLAGRKAIDEPLRRVDFGNGYEHVEVRHGGVLLCWNLRIKKPPKREARRWKDGVER